VGCKFWVFQGIFPKTKKIQGFQGLPGFSGFVGHPVAYIPCSNLINILYLFIYSSSQFPILLNYYFNKLYIGVEML